jgi:hypothetical protein
MLPCMHSSIIIKAFLHYATKVEERTWLRWFFLLTGIALVPTHYFTGLKVPHASQALEGVVEHMLASR